MSGSRMLTVAIPAGLGVLLALACSAATRAALIVVPGEYRTAEAPGDNRFPFFPHAQQLYYQQLYDASEFASLSGPTSIVEIVFRPNGSLRVAQGAFSKTIPNITISLSTTDETVASLSGNLSGNRGPDQTVVYSGSLMLASAAAGPAAGPKEFDVSIVLDTRFEYDPTQGNLLLEVLNLEESSYGLTLLDFDDDSLTDVGADTIARVFSFDGFTSTIQRGRGLVTGFVFIPEPSTFAIAAIGFVSLLRYVRRERLRKYDSS